MQSKNVYNQHKKSLNTKADILDKKFIPDENGNVKYIVYYLQRTKSNGEIVKFFKAVKFLRLLHTSQESKENKKFMEIHTDVYRSMCSANIETIEIIANILHPEPLGTIILYGTQATGSTFDSAIRNVDNAFASFLSAFTGTHRQCHVSGVSLKLMRNIFSLMEEQQFVTCVKGIPNTKQTSGNSKNLLQVESNTEEQLEQFISGLTEVEYCMMLTISPMSLKYIRSWENKTLDRWTYWEKQKQGNMNVGLSVGVPLSLSQGISQGKSYNDGTNTGTNTGKSGGDSYSRNEGTNQNFSEGSSTGVSGNVTNGTNTGWNESNGTSSNNSISNSNSHGTNLGVSAGPDWLKINSGLNNTTGQSITSGGGTSQNHGTSGGTSNSVSDGWNESTNKSNSYGNSSGESWSKNNGWSEGSSTGKSSSTGSNFGTNSGMSFGANVGFNFSKGYQWHDMKVEYICELLKVQSDRLKMMDSGDGGAFVDLYISTRSAEGQNSVIGAVGVSWNNPNAKIDRLRCEVPSKAEQIKLQHYMLSFSPCQEVVTDPKDKQTYYYKFSNVLATSEYVSFNHPPRITIDGLDNSLGDIPEFSVPTNRQDGEIFIGNVMRPSKFSFESAMKNDGNGYVTDIKYTIKNSEMLHAFIAAGSRSGKSVLAQRMVLEMYNKAFYTDKYGNKKHRRVLVFDPKGDWRALANVIPKGKFKFYSIGKIGFHNLKLNLMRVPKAVNPMTYVNNLIEMFCNAQGLLQKGKNEFRDVILGLYKENHVLDNPNDKTWAWEKSKNLTMTDLYEEIMKRKKEAEEKKTTGRNSMDAWESYENRLKMFSSDIYTEYQVFCNRGGDSIEMLLGVDDFTIIESAGLEARTQEFFFTLAMTTIYEYALQFGPKGFYKNEVETVIVIEEANSIIAEKKGEFGNQDAIMQFNTILDKAAGLGLFFWIITQKISEMPKSCIANSGLTFVGRNQNDDDKKIIMSTFGYNDRIDYKYMNFIARMPIGVFICRTARTFNFVDQVPVLVKVAMLKTTTPEDEQLDTIIKHHEIARKKAEKNPNFS